MKTKTLNKFQKKNSFTDCKEAVGVSQDRNAGNSEKKTFYISNYFKEQIKHKSPKNIPDCDYKILHEVP